MQRSHTAGVFRGQSNNDRFIYISIHNSIYIFLYDSVFISIYNSTCVSIYDSFHVSIYDVLPRYTTHSGSFAFRLDAAFAQGGAFRGQSKKAARRHLLRRIHAPSAVLASITCRDPHPAPPHYDPFIRESWPCTLHPAPCTLHPAP